MPKVYLSQAERDAARDERRRKKMIEMIYGKMGAQHIKLGQLGIGTRQAAYAKLRDERMRYEDLVQVFYVQHWTDEEILKVMKKDA